MKSLLRYVRKGKPLKGECLFKNSEELRIVTDNNKMLSFSFFPPQRRGAISYDSSDQTALYIRMLGKCGHLLHYPVLLCLWLSAVK